MKDLKDIQADPIDLVSAFPVDDSNMFIWHCNIKGTRATTPSACNPHNIPILQLPSSLSTRTTAHSSPKTFKPYLISFSFLLLFTSFSCSPSLSETFVGPENTAYAKGIFHVEIKFPEDYPNSPPSAIMLTNLPHPHVHNVCASTFWCSNFQLHSFWLSYFFFHNPRIEGRLLLWWQGNLFFSACFLFSLII